MLARSAVPSAAPATPTLASARRAQRTPRRAWGAGGCWPWVAGFSALASQMRPGPKSSQALRRLGRMAMSSKLSGTRRGLSLGIASAGLAGPATAEAPAPAEPMRQLFRVAPAASGSAPKKLSRTSSEFPQELADDCDVVILGEHHNSSSDHSMEADFTREFTKERGRRAGIPPAVGLEMVEQQFQPILDSFGRGEMTVKDLYEATEWSKRWVWPFDLYAPVFEAARQNGSPLVALNPATEVRRRLPLEGLRALTQEDRGLYLPDAVGFAATLREPAFRSYADLVVMPSYDTHVAGEWLGSRDETVATPQNFLSARVFRDEAMAYAAWRYLNKDQRRGMLLIVGCDHVRYDFGIPARLKRLGSGSTRWQAERPLLLHSAKSATSAVQGQLAAGEVFQAEADGEALKLQDQRGFVLPDKDTGAFPCSLVEGRKLKITTVLLNPTAQEELSLCLPLIFGRIVAKDPGFHLQHQPVSMLQASRPADAPNGTCRQRTPRAQRWQTIFGQKPRS
ncbi:unnamed protein product [Durusdinium trenchii]|uniref:Haem-binding uptake Tiki superfamily ChaN domain-containing protein n=1 Tax=Durusdinium trenchii TaxID=1381693 RepID=A0ABP0RSL3_9DINO